MDDQLTPVQEVADPVALRLERARALQRAARFTAIAGIAYAVLFIASMWLLTQVPDGDAPPEEIVGFYQSDDRDVVSLVALYLIPFAGIAFLWFVVALRMWISNRVERPVSVLFSNIQLCSGIVFLGLLFASAAALSVNAVAIDVGDRTLSSAQMTEFPEYGTSLFFVFATRMGAMFVFTTTNIGRESKILPNWFAAVGLVVGLVMLLTASFNRSLIIVFPAWVLVLCLLILLHARRAADAMRQGESATSAATFGGDR